MIWQSKRERGAAGRTETIDRRRAGEAQLTEQIKESAATRVRYGYRRIHVLLRCEGWRVNPKRVYRLLYRRWACICATKRPSARVVQWKVPGRLLERTLVHEPRRRAAKMRALA
jgi:hypothetical protein